MKRARSLREIDRLLPASRKCQCSSRSPHSNRCRCWPRERFDDSGNSQFSSASFEGLYILTSPTAQNYVNEALRLVPAVGGVVRRARADVYITGGTSNSVHIKAGTLVYVDWTKVNRDPSAFPLPDQIRLDRTPTLYKLAEAGVRSCESLSLPSSHRRARIDIHVLPSSTRWLAQWCDRPRSRARNLSPRQPPPCSGQGGQAVRPHGDSLRTFRDGDDFCSSPQSRPVILSSINGCSPRRQRGRPGVGPARVRRQCLSPRISFVSVPPASPV